MLIHELPLVSMMLMNMDGLIEPALTHPTITYQYQIKLPLANINQSKSRKGPRTCKESPNCHDPIIPTL